MSELHHSLRFRSRHFHLRGYRTMRPRFLLVIAGFLALSVTLTAQQSKPPAGKPPEGKAGDKPAADAGKPAFEPFKDGPLGDDKDKPTPTDMRAFRELTTGKQPAN